MDMKKMMEKMKAKKGREMSEQEREAKMSVLKDLRSAASEMMADGLKGLKKVTVASDSEEGLEKGLDKAKELLGEAPEMMEEMSEEEEMEPSDASPMALEEESDEEDMDEEELNRKLEKLMALKKKKGLA